MRTISRVGAASAATALVFLVVACGDPTSVVLLAPSVPGIVGIEIGGPDSVAPGQSAQFTATIRLSDGSRKTASPTDVRWLPGDAALLRMNASGLATGVRIGEVILTVEVRVPNGAVKRETKEVVIVPDGTYRLDGVVSEAESPSTPVSGARVEVTPGSLGTITGLAGQYRLYGVPADANIQVTRDGYEPVVQSLRLTTHATEDFRLRLSGPRLALTGPYTLAIDVGGPCDGTLSPDLHHRRYDAVLTQNGLSVEVLLTEPRFRLNSAGRGNRFSGHVDAAGATFTILPYDVDDSAYPDVAERVPDGTVLIVYGTVATKGSAAGLSGQMSIGSTLERFDSRFPTDASFLGDCNYRSPLVFTLTPR